jgi:hypothetical protein
MAWMMLPPFHGLVGEATCSGTRRRCDSSRAQAKASAAALDPSVPTTRAFTTARPAASAMPHTLLTLRARHRMDRGDRSVCLPPHPATPVGIEARGSTRPAPMSGASLSAASWPGLTVVVRAPSLPSAVEAGVGAVSGLTCIAIGGGDLDHPINDEL